MIFKILRWLPFPALRIRRVLFLTLSVIGQIKLRNDSFKTCPESTKALIPKPCELVR